MTTWHLFRRDLDPDVLSFGLTDISDTRALAQAWLEKNRKTRASPRDYEWNINPGWRLLGNADALVSEVDTDSFQDGGYAKASAGCACRPIVNECLNPRARGTNPRGPGGRTSSP